MADTTITLPAPFELGSQHNRIKCLCCEQESYASEFFGEKVDSNNKSTWAEWTIGLVHLNRMIGPEDMFCPKCGARENGSLGNRINNFMVTER